MNDTWLILVRDKIHDPNIDIFVVSCFILFCFYSVYCFRLYGLQFLRIHNTYPNYSISSVSVSPTS